MTVLGRSLIFQPVLTSLPYTQTCTYDNNDTIITLQNLLTLQVFHQNYEKGNMQKNTMGANVFDIALNLSTLHVKKNSKGHIHMKIITEST